MKQTIVLFSIIEYVHAIYGGHNTTIFRHKWQLSLRDKNHHFCGAALLNFDWALTAASCVEHKHSDDLTIRGGATNLTGPDGVIAQIDYFIIHPRYDNHTLDSNLALLHFAKTINDSSVYNASLPFCTTCDVVDYSSTTMTGWGRTEDGEYANELQMGYVSSLSRESCQVAYPEMPITLNMFCAGSFQKGYNTSACDGDYGGPVMVYGRLEGIMSYGNGCNGSIFPSVMTRVAAFMSWITDRTEIKKLI